MSAIIRVLWSLEFEKHKFAELQCSVQAISEVSSFRFNQLREMQNGSTNSNLELRGPRNDLRTARRSHRGVDKAPEAPSR
eukprot:1807542-Alexandrium_andersonii.AAC.1